MKKIKVGFDFAGVGAFDQALIKLGIDYETIFACDMDKYARKTFIANYGEPKYYPENVYDRKIPTESLDIYMTSPPCQAFSLAGKRKGESDDRGVLFYNSHEVIKVNKPRFFIFENVKGLLSDDNGKTFQRWIDYLGGKSVNGNTVIFPHDESVPYHVYYKVLNAKDYGVPQNRERVFIIGIRDDEDNSFNWPREMHLEKRLRDVLEPEVDGKYYLSEKMIKGFIKHTERHSEKGNGFKWEAKNENDIANCLLANAALANTLKVGFINQDTQASQVFSEDGSSPNICAGTNGYANGYIQVKSATSNGYETAKIGAIRGRNPDNPKSRESGLKTEQMFEINENGVSNCLTTVHKDNVVIEQKSRGNNKGGLHKISPTITSNSWQENNKLHIDCRIRKLTPLECFRLMGFPDSVVTNARNAGVSDSQLYKQAGNSIVVDVLYSIISKLKL